MTNRNSFESTLTDPVVEAIVDKIKSQEANAKNRSLGEIVARHPAVKDVLAGRRRNEFNPAQLTARVRNLLATDPHIQHGPTAVSRPAPMATTPLLEAIGVVDDATGVILPVTVSMTNAADIVPEGDPSAEAALVYVSGDWEPMQSISHHIPVTKQAIKHNPTLRSDINRFLSAGVLVRLEALVAGTLAAESGFVAHAFDTDLATTVRTAIAAAQSAFRELGPGRISVVLSPSDHAALDLSGHDLSQWPATIVSSPSVADGFAYVGRFELAAQLYTSVVHVAAGWVANQFAENKVTIRAGLDAYVHVSAPGAIVKADLTA